VWQYQCHLCSQKPSFSQKNETPWVETPLPKRPCWEGRQEISYIDTKRHLADIFTKPLDASHFAALQGGGLVFAILMARYEGEVVFYLVYLYLSAFL
jgi:hypothetical protein